MPDFPCKNCICVPICRFKSYGQLFTDCKLLVVYINEGIDEKADIHTISHIIDTNSSILRNHIQDCLNPVSWAVDASGIFLRFGGKNLTPQKSAEIDELMVGAGYYKKVTADG